MTKNALTIQAGSQMTPIVPRNLDEVYRLSQAIALSGIAPDGMKKPEQVMIAVMHGMEIGLPPMQAVQRIAVIHGRPTLWGDAIPALLWARGFKIDEGHEGEGDTRTAWCEITRPDGHKVRRTFSVAEAKKANLWDKSGPWRNYQDRMLAMRARGFAARDGAPDVLSGLYLAEEVQDMAPMRDVTPAPLEIPEELFADEPEQIEPTAEVSADEPIADADGLIQRIRDDLELAGGDAQVRGEIFEQYEDLIGRLPRSKRAEAESLFHLEAAE